MQISSGLLRGTHSCLCYLPEVDAICPLKVITTSTSVAGMRFLPVFVCLSVCFFAQCLKNDPARITQLDIETFHHEFWKPMCYWVKRSGPRGTKKLSVFRQHNISAGCIRKQRWVFPAAVPRRTTNASDTGFS